MSPRCLCAHTLRVFALALTIMACSDPSDPRGNGSLDVQAFARGPVQRTDPSGAHLGSVSIERVLIVLGRVKLESGSDATIDFVDERSGVVQVDLDGDPVLALSLDVPPGIYKELELAVDKLERGHPDEQSLIASFPRLDNASVLIEGMVLRAGFAEPFSFATDLDIDLELTFGPPLEIGAAESAPLIALVLDLGEWFRASSGRLLDPTNPADRSPIEGNIQKSIELFEGPGFRQ